MHSARQPARRRSGRDAVDHFPAGRSRTRTGHRRDHDGAVPVTDLTTHLPDAERAESGVAGLDPEAPRNADLVRATLVPATPSTRLTITALCLVLLCGAAAAISAIVSYSPRRTNESPQQAVAPIAGAWTFRPDLLHQARWPFTADAGPHRAHDSGGDRPEPASEVPKTPPRRDIRAPEHTATEFYSLLSTGPERAVDMLSPALVGDQRDEIVRAWREVASVRATRVRPEPDGSLLADVAVAYPDGSRITSRHELVISPDQRIVGARLRSAQITRDR